MRWFYLVAVVAVLATLALGVVSAAGKLSYFLDWPSVIMVLAPVIVLSLASFPPSTVGRSFAVAFERRKATDAELKAAAVFFRSLQSFVLLSGAISSMIGLVTILANLRDLSSVGKGAALLLVSLFYALVLTLVVAIPFRTAVERRLAERG